MTRVSIYMASYNHASYLRRAIDSVLRQTFADFELFIVRRCLHRRLLGDHPGLLRRTHPGAAQSRESQRQTGDEIASSGSWLQESSLLCTTRTMFGSLTSCGDKWSFWMRVPSWARSLPTHRSSTNRVRL